MAKSEFAHPNEMHKCAGQEIGVSDWVELTQERINLFAEATGDHQWIHIDVERAKKDMPGGKTIAHGFLTLSLIPMLNQPDLAHQQRAQRHQLRLQQGTLHQPGPGRLEGARPCQADCAADPMDKGGVRLTNQVTIEIEGQERPACVAETMAIVYGT